MEQHMDRTGENVGTERLQPPPQGIKVKSRWLRNMLTFFVVFGPGLIVMEADNDAGAVSTCTQAGGQYGLHLLWLMLLLLPVCYFIQEMVVAWGSRPAKVTPE
jgi:Mn2+/Fe2+ NRAMP family transporter